MTFALYQAFFYITLMIFFLALKSLTEQEKGIFPPMNKKVFYRFFVGVSSYEGLAVGRGSLYNHTMQLERLVWRTLPFTV